MVITELDRFVGVVRDTPIAPVWVVEVQGGEDNPLKVLRTAHWVRKKVEDALPSFATTLSPDAPHMWSSIIREMNSLIVSPPHL